MSTKLAEVPTGRDSRLEPGTHVEVRSRFDASWNEGFEVIAAAADTDTAGYRLRRLSDGAELPTAFAPDDVRPTRRRNNMWWY